MDAGNTEYCANVRVVLVVHQFFPSFSAGTEVLTLGVARELRARGHIVHIVAGHPGQSDMNDSERWVRDHFDGFDVDRFHHADVPMHGQRSIIEVGSDNALAAQRFASLLHEFRPDHVHYFHFGRLGTGLILAANIAGVRQSFTPTDFWAVCPFAQLRLPNGDICSGPSKNSGNCVKHYGQLSTRPLIVQWTARFLPTPLADALVPLSHTERTARHPILAEVRALNERTQKTISRLNLLQHILVPNYFMREKLLEYGVDPKLMVDSAFGIELPKRELKYVNQDIANAPLRIGFIGTLAPHKGLHVLIKAVTSLPLGSFFIRIYGNLQDFPNYVSELRYKVIGREDIEFEGTFPSAEIFDVLENLDVLVVPSLWFENTPLVVYSAQAAGKIVVASDYPGISSSVRHGIDGLLFPAGDYRALAKLLKILTTDRELRKLLTSSLRRPRSIAKYVDHLVQLWNEPTREP